MGAESDRSPDFKAGLGADEPPGQIPGFLRPKQCLCRCSIVISAAAEVPPSSKIFFPLSASPSASFRLLLAKEKGRESREAREVARGFIPPFLPSALSEKEEDRCCLFVTDGNPDLNAAGFLQRVHWVMHKRKSKLPLQPVPTYTARWRPLARNCCKKIHAKDVEAGGEREGGGKGGR